MGAVEAAFHTGSVSAMAQAAPSRNGFMRLLLSLDSHAGGSYWVFLLLAIFVSGNLEAQPAKSILT